MADSNITLIALDGRGGSGKSTLAKMLSQKLEAEILHIDDFSGLENPTNWHEKIIANILEPIKSGVKVLSYPRAKWWQTHYPEPVVNQPVTPIMILEGIGALRPELKPYIDFGIFVNTPQDICFERGFLRDRGQDNKTDQEIKQIWQDWQKKEEVFMQSYNPLASANQVVDGTQPFENQGDFTKWDK